MSEGPKENLFDIRLLMLPDRMHVINNMDVDTRASLPSMQLWEVENGPVVIEASSGDARIFMDGKWCRWTRGKLFLMGRLFHFRCLKRNGPVSFL
jgi:hypothetical protein